MLEITKERNGESLKVGLKGRLDTNTAGDLEDALDLEGIQELTIDFTDLDYISSAGLRVLLAAQKIMSLSGEMKVENVSESIMEIFDLTGFTDILTIV